MMLNWRSILHELDHRSRTALRLVMALESHTRTLPCQYHCSTVMLREHRHGITVQRRENRAMDTTSLERDRRPMSRIGHS